MDKEVGMGSSRKLWTRFGWKMRLAVAFGRTRFGSFKMLVSMLLATRSAALERLRAWVTTQMAVGWTILHECDEVVAVEGSYIIPEQVSASGLPANGA